MADLTDAYYELSELLDDDMYQSANIILQLSCDNLTLSEIVSDLEKLKLIRYKETINAALKLDPYKLRELAANIKFNPFDYVRYLEHLLNLHNIDFISNGKQKKTVTTLRKTRNA